MKVSDIITMIRSRLFDTKKKSYTDEDIVSYINESIILFGRELIAKEKSDLIVELVLTEETTVRPSDFGKWAGKYPVKNTGANLVVYGELPQTVRYFKTPALITVSTVDMPFDIDDYSLAIVHVATSLALNRNEYNITQDKAIADSIRVNI